MEGLNSMWLVSDHNKQSIIILSAIFIILCLCLIPVFCLEDNTDRPGGDYKKYDMTTPDPSLCQQYCAADPDCQAFTYVKPGIQGPYSSCYLKNTVPPAKSDSCCLSGTKTAQTSGSPVPFSTMDYSSIPGLVLHLWHNMNQPDPQLDSNRSDLIFLHGGDLGAPQDCGYSWWMIPDNQNADPMKWSTQLPPGLVLCLRHSSNQANDNRITVGGQNPVEGPDTFGGLVKQNGGDRDGSEGEGYYWYETFNPNFQNWDDAEKTLPKGTILGLKHSMNQPDKTVYWRGQEYDPVKCFRSAQEYPSPPTFAPRHGGDRGTPSGEGYYWFEKVDGPDYFKPGPASGPICGEA